MTTAPGKPLLQLDNVTRSFDVGGKRALMAVRNLSLQIQPGEVVGLVGESGSGKSTIGRMAIALLPPTEGRVRFDGSDLATMAADDLRRLRQRMQIIFQDPWGALNPRHTIGRLMEEPLLLHTSLTAQQRREEVVAMAQRMQLGLPLLERYPAQLSGGQLQRVCIGRALATKPDLLVLDEPTSSLDVSVRAGILQLLDTLRRETGVAMLFISHDLETIHALCDRVVVLYLGCEVESGPVESVFKSPAHPYTQALLSAQLFADPAVKTERQHLQGEIPSPLAAPPGCPFSTRCPVYESRCDAGLPAMRVDGATAHAARCIRLASDRFQTPTGAN
jgi:oligopeptide/dipeptide ABC transporter ATP-binding protein